MRDSNGVALMSKPDENDKQPDPSKLFKGLPRGRSFAARPTSSSWIGLIIPRRRRLGTMSVKPKPSATACCTYSARRSIATTRRQSKASSSPPSGSVARSTHTRSSASRRHFSAGSRFQIGVSRGRRIVASYSWEGFHFVQFFQIDVF